jgi:hypothetical protein
MEATDRRPKQDRRKGDRRTIIGWLFK